MLKVFCFVSTFFFAIFPSRCYAQEPPRIEDNSFLIEEAYNQEAGVVQHINSVLWDPQTESWDYTFTQEWPLGSQRHQFSYTLPISRVTDPADKTGIADFLVNYRYQALNSEGLAFSPRFSLILPSGEGSDGLGSESLGYQVNLPLSFDLTDKIIMHWNLGATYTPDAEDTGGESADNLSFNYGASLIYLSTPNFNLMLEIVGSKDQITIGENSTAHDSSFFVSPGFRYAFDFVSGLQIVPGAALPIGFGSSRDEFGVIGYLSFEHPF